MNELNFSRMCSLVFDAGWHHLLCAIDEQLYQQYADQLVGSNGCRTVQLAMRGYLSSLTQSQYKEVIAYLYDKHPRLLDGYIPGFRPRVQTFPRRELLLVSELPGYDRWVYKYIIYCGLVYVEYLLPGDPVQVWRLDSLSEQLRVELHEKEA